MLVPRAALFSFEWLCDVVANVLEPKRVRLKMLFF